MKSKFINVTTTQSVRDLIGRGIPDPFHESLDSTADYWLAYAHAMYKIGKPFGIGSNSPKREYFMPQYDGRIIIASAYGADIKTMCWDDKIGTYHIEKGGLWHNLKSIKEIEAIEVPQWEKLPLIEASLDAFKRFEAKVGHDYARNCGVLWTDAAMYHAKHQTTYRIASVPSFIDLGGFLIGESEFLEQLAGDPELSVAMMKKCAEIAISYAKYMAKLYDRPIIGYGSLGGDNSCLLSPDMYERYAMAFDALIRQEFGNLPRNLHSCGASRHLYKIWSKYSEKEKIVFLQTRALPGTLTDLRRSLPDTFIQLTMFVPEFDFSHDSSENFLPHVEQWVEDLKEDFSLTLIIPELNDTALKNVELLQNAVCKKMK